MAQTLATQQVSANTGGGGGMLGEPHTHQQPDEHLSARRARADAPRSPGGERDAPSNEAMMNAISQAHYELRSKNHPDKGHVPMAEVTDRDERRLRQAINSWGNMPPKGRRTAYEVALKHLGKSG
jgi:hypothetical protein